MSEAGHAAYITGGASGLGKAVASMLVSKGCKVFIADRDAKGAQAVVDELNKKDQVAFSTDVDAADWNSQAEAFSKAVGQLKRIDYVYPIAGIGERVWTPNDPTATSGFVKPDLSVIDIDLTGLMYTVSLALQQFRRQEVGKNGTRGKIGCIASVCGIYCVPTLPIYTSAKHAVTGFVRSFGKYLPEEQITMNAVNPNVIRTNISQPAFYDKLEKEGLLTPMDGVIEAFEWMLGDNMTSGECFEIPPKGGFHKREPPAYFDKQSEEVCEALYHRARPLQQPR